MVIENSEGEGQKGNGMMVAGSARHTIAWMIVRALIARVKEAHVVDIVIVSAMGITQGERHAIGEGTGRRKNGYGRRKQMDMRMMVVERRMTEPMNTGIAVIITIIIVLITFTVLLVLNFATTPAYALNLLPMKFDHVLLEGPAPGAAPTPRKRGPLPPPTCGRGRLPRKRARALTGPGPQLPWPYARAHCKNVHDELGEQRTEVIRSSSELPLASRRASAAGAMVRLGMASGESPAWAARANPRPRKRPAENQMADLDKSNRRQRWADKGPSRPKDVPPRMPQPNQQLLEEDAKHYHVHAMMNLAAAVGYLPKDTLIIIGAIIFIIITTMYTPLHTSLPIPFSTYLALYIFIVETMIKRNRQGRRGHNFAERKTGGLRRGPSCWSACATASRARRATETIRGSKFAIIIIFIRVEIGGAPVHNITTAVNGWERTMGNMEQGTNSPLENQ